VQLFQRLSDQLSRAQAGVHESLDRAQLRNVAGVVLSLRVVVATRTRKAIPALPDSKHVFRQPGLTLDRANVERAFGMFHATGCLGRVGRCEISSVPAALLSV